MTNRFPAFAGSAIVSAFVVSFLGQPAFAQTSDFAIEVPGVSNYVAAAAGWVPDYLGSDDYRFGAAPVARISFGDSKRYLRLLVTNIQVNLIDSSTWSFGPALNYRLGRSNVDDNAVDNMRDIDGTVEVGAFGNWTWVGQNDPRHRFSLGTEVLFDVGGEHEGYLISGSVRYFQPVARPLTLSIGASLNYGSGDYMDTYFGVNSGNVGSSGLSAFKADGGFLRSEIEAAHIRYCPTPPSQSGTPEQVNENNSLTPFQGGTSAPNVPVSKAGNPLENNDCSGVPVCEGGEADGACDDADVVKDLEPAEWPDSPTFRGVV